MNTKAIVSLKKQLEQMYTEDFNQYCFDCYKKPALWASWNNGVFLCLECSGEHRGLGNHVSNLRSVTIDTWNENQVMLLKCGGNKRLKDFLTYHNIPRNISKKTLYCSKIMAFYRKMLKAESACEIFMQKLPDRQEMLDPSPGSLNPEIRKFPFDTTVKQVTITDRVSLYTTIRSSYDNEDRYLSISSDALDQAEEEVTTTHSRRRYLPSISRISSYIGSFFSKTKDIAYAVKEKVSDIALSRKILYAGGTIFSVLHYTGSKVYEKGSQLVYSDTVKSIASKAGNGLYYLKWKFSRSRDDDDPWESYSECREDQSERLIDKSLDYSYIKIEEK